MSRLERAAAVVLTLLGLVLIVTDAVPLLRGPAPYPPEWQWERRAEGPAAARYAWPLGCASVMLGLLAASGSRFFRERPRGGACLLLAGSTVAGTGFLLGLLGLEPDGALPTLLARVISRTDSSYYTVAVSPEARDPLAFLDRHAELLLAMRKTAKHAATHPPGPVLYYRATIALCEHMPALTRLGLASLGLREDEGLPRRPPHTPASVAGALVGGLCLLALCAAACWPIALLVRALGRDPLTAARVAMLWPLLPGPALMSPQFDQALALPVAGAVALLALAVTLDGRPSRMAAAAGAGTLAFAAGFFSYGAPAFVAAGAIAVLVSLPDREAQGVWMPAVLVATFTAVAWVRLTVALGHEPLEAMRTALAFHRDVYTAPRSHALWLAFNPIDFALFLGVPVAAVGLMRVRRTASATGRFRLALLFALGVLLLSGSIRGEFGRIGIPLMALGLAAALGDAETAPRDAALLGALLAVLSVVLRAFWILP